MSTAAKRMITAKELAELTLQIRNLQSDAKGRRPKLLASLQKPEVMPGKQQFVYDGVCFGWTSY